MDIDKGYVPEGISQPQKSTKKWPPLIIGLFPYVPRIRQFQTVITRHWVRRRPDIPIEFREFNCYKEDPHPDLHVFCADNIFLSKYVNRGWVKSWKAEEIHEISDFFPFARRSCTINNTFFAVPHLGCVNTILYRKENVLLRDAIGPQGILKALGVCPNPHMIWPAPNTGLLLSFAKPTTTALYYLLACNAINNTYPPFPLLPGLGTLDKETLEILRIYTEIAGHAQVNYVDAGAERITKLVSGGHQGIVGVSELACFLPLDKLSNYALRLFSYSTRPGEQAQPYVDGLAINNSISNPEHVLLCRELINLIASPQVQLECQISDSEKSNPQFLVPSRRSTLDQLIRIHPWYEHILHVLPQGEGVVPCILDENSSTWLNSEVPSVIRGRIAGPQSPAEQQKIADLSGDPSLPANLVEKW